MYPLTVAYQIPKLPSETDHQYQHRRWFVGKQQPQTRTEFNQAIKWSLIDMYTQFYGCVYSEEVRDILIRKQNGFLAPLTRTQITKV